MIVHKDCEEYYLYGDNLPDLACVFAENEGLEPGGAVVVTLRFPGSSDDRRVGQTISQWLVAIAKQEA